MFRRVLAVQLAIFGLLFIAWTVSSTGYAIGHAVADQPLTRFLGRSSLIFALLWLADACAMVATMAFWLLQTSDPSREKKGSHDPLADTAEPSSSGP